MIIKGVSTLYKNKNGSISITVRKDLAEKIEIENKSVLIAEYDTDKKEIHFKVLQNYVD